MLKSILTNILIDYFISKDYQPEDIEMFLKIEIYEEYKGGIWFSVKIIAQTAHSEKYELISAIKDDVPFTSIYHSKAINIVGLTAKRVSNLILEQKKEEKEEEEAKKKVAQPVKAQNTDESDARAWIHAHGSDLARLREKYNFSFIRLAAKELLKQMLSSEEKLQGFSLLQEDIYNELSVAGKDSKPTLKVLQEYEEPL